MPLLPFLVECASSSSSGRVARGSSSSAICLDLSGGRVGDDGGFKDREMDHLIGDKGLAILSSIPSLNMVNEQMLNR